MLPSAQFQINRFSFAWCKHVSGF
uniref:Uncharacterized protein n=1 Tax=Arundo donax TaxID=35708 RepID=A0A0A9BUK7_ARUDO